MVPSVVPTTAVPHGNSIAADTDRLALDGGPVVDHLALWVRAFEAEGITRQKEMAALIGVPPAFCSQAFSWACADKNVVMKRLSVRLDDGRSAEDRARILRVTRRYCHLLGEQVGVVPPDARQVQRVVTLAASMRAMLDLVLGDAR